MKINTVGKLHIKNRTLSQWLAIFIFVMPFLLSFLTTFLGLPNILKYTIDVAWLSLVIIALCKSHITFSRKLTPVALLVGAFAVFTLIVYLFNYQSIIYYLWGFRNNFRFYVAFFAFAVLFSEGEVDFCFKLMDVFFWINVVVSLYQFFVLGLSWDYLGGIFGAETGCNSYSIIFYSIVIAKSILQFMNKQEKFILCFSKCLVALVLSAMAELKFFFVIFAIIMLMSTILTSFSWRKLIIIIISGVIIVLAGNILTGIFGDSSRITVDRLIELATSESYSNNEDLGRFTAIPTISNTILVEPYQKIFGLGLGNCDTSSFAICNTPFFESHGYLHYTWFSSAFLFLETGYLGLAIYICFFIFVMIFSIIQLKKSEGNKLYCGLAIIISVICMTLVFYNSSLRTEVAYMAYFVLALPFIVPKSKTRESNLL